MPYTVTIFKNIQATSTPFFIDVNKIFDRIRKCHSKELVKKIRKEPEKKARDIIKKDLPSICFSGRFKNRSIKGCLQHSGLICVDFDKYENETIYNEQREILKSDKYTFALFTSPSGNGLKVIVKIPAKIDEHTQRFKALQEYYKSPYFDITTQDISRVCYESIDSDIYINENSEEFTDIIKDEHFEIETRPPVLKLNSDIQIINKLQKWFDKKYTMGKGERNANLFKFASALNEFGITYNDAISHLNNYEASDFNRSEIERTVKSAYSNTTVHNTKYFEDNETKAQIKTQLKSGLSIEKVCKTFPEYSEEQIQQTAKELEAEATVLEFWNVSSKGKINVVVFKYKSFLEQNGYFKYCPKNSQQYHFVHIENSFIEATTTENIKDFVLNYLLNNNEYEVYEVMAKSPLYFRDDFLSLLASIADNFYKDTKEYAMLYYRNCAVKVYADKIKQIEYINLDGMVWKHHVIDRDFQNTKFEGCYLDKFCHLISGNDEQRKKSLKSAIGYLLHSYKTSANNTAIIFNDEKISDKPNGGSGKGLVCRAISEIKRTVIIDGKRFDPKATFTYQRVTPETQMLVFDDIKKNFDFEYLFSIITEGITVEKKNKDEIHIPIDKSPKIAITTNYTIPGDGGSFARRRHDIELSSHFNELHTPYDEFGILLYDDFDKLEWQRFDCFMIDCIQIFLKEGIVKCNYVNFKQKQLINDTSREFYEWVKTPESNVLTKVKLYRNELYDSFINFNIDSWSNEKYRPSKKSFKGYLDRLAFYFEMPIIHGRDQTGQWTIIDGTEDKTLENKYKPVKDLTLPF